MLTRHPQPCGTVRLGRVSLSVRGNHQRICFPSARTSVRVIVLTLSFLALLPPSGWAQFRRGDRYRGIGSETHSAGIAGRLRGLESDRTGGSRRFEARGSILRKISSIVDKDFLDKTVPEAMERSQVDIRHFLRATLGRFESRLPEKS